MQLVSFAISFQCLSLFSGFFLDITDDETRNMRVLPRSSKQTSLRAQYGCARKLSRCLHNL